MEVAKTGRRTGQLELGYFCDQETRKDRHNDERKILDRTLEQFTCAGTGTSRSVLYDRRFIHLALDGTQWNDRAGSNWCTVLTRCRISYSHAVRMASEQLSYRRRGQKGIQEPGHQDGFLGF